jgi:probable phosphoglycerate mutase
MSTKIILTRHGHVAGIAPPRFRGRENIPLTDLGRRQARAVAERISRLWRPRAVYTSPMQRCIDTGDAIAKACGLAGTAIDALNDLDYGDWQWKTYAEVEVSSPDAYATWHRSPQLVRFPKGESLQDLVARTGEAVRLVLRDHGDQIVVLVGHDSVNRALLLQLLDQPLSAYWRIAFDPCGLTEIDFNDGRFSVRRVNDIGHLEALARPAGDG